LSFVKYKETVYFTIANYIDLYQTLLLVMCSCSIKGRASLVIEKQKQRLQKRKWAEAGAEVAGGRGDR